MGKIIWTEKAVSHLQAIHEYISKDSGTYANRFIKSLIQTTQKLKSMPQCWRIVPEFAPLGFRELFFHQYRIVYRVLGPNKNIEILAIVHGAREIESLFDQD